LFHKVVHLVINRGSHLQRPLSPEPTAGVEQIVVCSLSGLEPGEHCPNCCSVYVMKESKSRPICDMHRLIRIDKRNGLLASQRCPIRFVEEKVFEVLPPVYSEWQAQHSSQMPPVKYSPFCPPGGITPNALVISRPRRGEVFLLEPGYDRAMQTIELSGEVDPVLPEVTWWVDGEKVAVVGWPYDSGWQMERGKHLLVMKGGGMQSDTVEFEVR